MVSNTRLYGASISLVSGVYSLWSASMASRMVTSALLMAALGVVVIAHGALLLTPYADRLGRASGPLMVAYSLLMLLNQALLSAGVLADGSDMMGMGAMGGSGMTAGMGWDAGMAALAVLMLLSGAIMSRGPMGSSDGM
jgi:hypothetical protein